jgi:hypothetical protein
LYWAVLGREPDPDGAQFYEGLVRKIGAERAVPRILKAFQSSAEYRQRADALAVSYINSSLASQGDRLVNGRPVEHLAPLGCFCLPALLFQNYGLRRYSLPFDWIFSSPQMVRECLSNDFAEFLDRRHYRSVTGDKRTEPGADHVLYRERFGVPGLFAHRDPTREDDYLYFVRCVTRFRQLLGSEDAKLFLFIVRPEHDMAAEFPLLIEALGRLTTNFVLQCIQLMDPAEDRLTTIAPLAAIGDHALHRVTPSAFNAAGSFLPDKFDEWSVLRLVCRYRLVLKDSPWVGSAVIPPDERDESRDDSTNTRRHSPQPPLD